MTVLETDLALCVADIRGATADALEHARAISRDAFQGGEISPQYRANSILSFLWSIERKAAALNRMLAGDNRE